MAKTLDSQSDEWEVRARAWLSGLPQGQAVSMSEVESWIKSNHELGLPDDLKSMSLSDLLHRFTQLQSSIPNLPVSNSQPPQQGKTARQVEYPFRFQRTDRWLPVYTWLESLNADEVVKSTDISDWLSANPKICEQLCSRHSRYHLTHYIKKCHAKILKRQDKLKVEPPKTAEAASKKAHHVDVLTAPASMTSNQLVNVPKDSDLFQSKRKEALHKYQVLVELEKQLTAAIQKQSVA